MKANPQNVWSVPAFLPYLQPVLTEDIIRKATDEIGYSLPQAYLELLRVQNGGYIRFSLPDIPHTMICGIGPSFPSITGYSWEEVMDQVSFSLRGLIPFDGDGHWHLCFDYRANREVPSVAYVDIEGDSHYQVATTFQEYLDTLLIDLSDEWVLEEVGDIRAVLGAMSRFLQVPFDEPDSSAHGYPVFRAALGTEDRPEWVWISPNDVPRGFIRENHPRFVELKDRLPGETKRYPSLRRSSYLVSATTNARSMVAGACGAIGLALKPLSGFIV